MGQKGTEIADLASFASSLADSEREPVVIVAGCGSATTVRSLRDHDVAAFGFDKSDAVLEHIPEKIHDAVTIADLRDETLVDSLCSTFDIDTIDVFMTECMLSFLDLDEAERALSRIRDHPAVGVLVHKVQTDPPVPAQEGEIEATVLRPAEWSDACDPNTRDLWYDALNRMELPDPEDISL